MKKFWIIGIVVLVAIFTIGGINKIPTLQEKVSAAWSQVQNQYQRRADLVPNLVETVKGYAKHEQQTLQGVIEARAEATKVTLTVDQLNDPAMVKKFEQAQGNLSSALSRLMAVAENYPNLKANENFLALQSQLEGTENRITVARQDYITVVQEYNTTVRTFPGMIWAAIYGAKAKPNFTATTAGAETAPAVKF
jgi:LemA protein